MTTRNSILLILKQSPGMEFTALLTRISSNYGNVNSARAALSRAIRDMQARGLVQRQGKRLFATDKGLSLLGSEMKSKLILRLNELVKHRSALDHVDRIVPLFSTLIERSKTDADLLKAARGNTAFYLSDVERLRGELQSRAQHLSYLASVLEQQVQSLRELNFSDSREHEWTAETKSFVFTLITSTPGNEILVEFFNPEFLARMKQLFSGAKQDGKTLFLAKTECEKLMQEAEKSPAYTNNPVNLYTGSVKIQLNHPRVFFTGPIRELDGLKETKISSSWGSGKPEHTFF